MATPVPEATLTITKLTAKGKRQRSSPSSTATATTTTIAARKKNVAKRTRAKKLEFFLACGSNTCIGVICAYTSEEAFEILQAECTDFFPTADMIVPISMAEEFCYPVSMGRPEKGPAGSAASSAISTTLYCTQDFDFLGGYTGRAMVVATSEGRAIELTDEYLRQVGCAEYAVKSYSIGEIPMEFGFNAF